MMIQMCDICPSVSSEPLPVHTAHISDYRESPETGVVFEIEAPAGNVFSRVNISYTEGQERRCMLYKGTDVLRVLSAGFCLQGSVCRVLSAGFCLQGSVDVSLYVQRSDDSMSVCRFLQGEDGVQTLVTRCVLPEHHLPADL